MKYTMSPMMHKIILAFFVINVLVVLFGAVFPFGLFPIDSHGASGVFYYAGLARPILINSLQQFAIYSIALILYRFKLIWSLIYIFLVNINYLFSAPPHTKLPILWLFYPFNSVSSVGVFTKLLVAYYLLQTLVVVLVIFIMLKNYLNRSKNSV